MDTLSPRTDEQLAELVQGGDMNSFEVLVARYQDRLMRYGKKMLFNPSDLEDMVQEVFIKAYRNFQSFDTSRKFSSWIYRIAHNEFINHGKKKSRQLIDYFDLEVFLPYHAGKTDIETDFDREQLKQVLDACMVKMDAKYSEPLVLYYYEGLDYKEIADILHIPVNTVGIRMLRAKKILKKYFPETK